MFHRKDIYWIYIKEKQHSPDHYVDDGRKTRTHGKVGRPPCFKVVHGLTPIYSERKWKMKLKEWEFYKYTTKKRIKAAEMTSKDGK